MGKYEKSYILTYIPIPVVLLFYDVITFVILELILLIILIIFSHIINIFRSWV